MPFGSSRSPLTAPCSLFNLLTARELGPKFGPRSVPYALGGKQDMMADTRGRSSRLRRTVARPVHASAAPVFLLPAPSSLLPAALMLCLAVAAHAQNHRSRPP